MYMHKREKYRQRHGKTETKRYGDRKIQKDRDRGTEMEKTDKQTENNIQQINLYLSCFGFVCGKNRQAIQTCSLPSQCTEKWESYF